MGYEAEEPDSKARDPNLIQVDTVVYGKNRTQLARNLHFELTGHNLHRNREINDSSTS